MAGKFSALLHLHGIGWANDRAAYRVQLGRGDVGGMLRAGGT